MTPITKKDVGQLKEALDELQQAQRSLLRTLRGPRQPVRDRFRNIFVARSVARPDETITIYWHRNLRHAVLVREKEQK